MEPHDDQKIKINNKSLYLVFKIIIAKPKSKIFCFQRECVHGYVVDMWLKSWLVSSKLLLVFKVGLLSMCISVPLFVRVMCVKRGGGSMWPIGIQFWFGF